MAAALLAGAGCGGDGRLSRTDYERQVKAEARSLVAASAVPGGDESALLRAEQRALTRVANDLDELKPPKDAETDHRRLVEGLRGVAAIFGSIRGPGTSEQRRRNALQALARSKPSREVQAALDGLEQDGYDVGAFGEGR